MLQRKEGNAMNVIERIQEKYGDMTRKQRVLADYMLENPDSMSFMTMKNLSGRTQVSEMTILNYCTALGYGNYNELKYEFRKYILMPVYRNMNWTTNRICCIRCVRKSLIFSSCCLLISIFLPCFRGRR